MSLSTVKCQRPWTDLLITTNGDCYNCCYQRNPMGNLREMPFEDIWNGPFMQETRRAFLENKIPTTCESGIGNCPELGRT